MASLKGSGKVTKQKNPVRVTPLSKYAGRKTRNSMVDTVHDTPVSRIAGKKTKGGLVGTNENEINKCLVCEDVILEASENEEGHEAVYCEGDCQGWIHRRCAGLTRPAFDNLSESIPYLCPYCTFTKQYKEICTLKETIKTLSNKLAVFEGTQLTSQAKAVPTVNQKSNLSRDTFGSTQAPLSDKKMNVVVYGLAENPSNTSRQDRLRKDVDSILSALKDLDSPIDANSIKDCYRLGKYSPQACKPRPVLVKFLRYTDASNVLGNKSKLSPLVFVKPDLTAEERAMESLLLKERRALIEKGVSRQHIRIRNQSLIVHNKVHAKIQNSQLVVEPPATVTLDASHNIITSDSTAKMESTAPETSK